MYILVELCTTNVWLSYSCNLVQVNNMYITLKKCTLKVLDQLFIEIKIAQTLTVIL